MRHIVHRIENDLATGQPLRGRQLRGWRTKDGSAREALDHYARLVAKAGIEYTIDERGDREFELRYVHQGREVTMRFVDLGETA